MARPTMGGELIIAPVATLRALLLFPIRPASARRALATGRAAWAAPLFPAAAALLYLCARGCRVQDAAAAAAALLLLLGAAGTGGALLLGATRWFLPGAAGPRAHLGSCLVCSAWAPVLFLAALAAARGLGAGGASALGAGLALLVWGIAMGMGMLADAAEDGGRALVGACLGMTGTLIGVWLGLALAPLVLVTAVPCPATVAGLEAGALLLVRVEGTPTGGSLVLLTGGGREAVLARADGGGGFAPVGVKPGRVGALGRLAPLGRVFFRFGGTWGGYVFPGEHPAEIPKD